MPKLVSVTHLSRATIRHGESPKRKRWDSFLGMIFALSGALFATALFNFGNSGIPIFYLILLLPFIAVIFSNLRPLRILLNKSDMRNFWVIANVCICMLAVTFLHVLFDVQPAGFELTHAAMRISFLGYAACCLYFMEGNILISCMYWLRRILTGVALYGIYQLPAKFLNLPLFLDWLRNNRSYDVYGFDTSGWVSLVRATSIYPEPSLCTVPVLVLILLTAYLPAPRYSKVFVWIVVVLFSILTFSRTIWLAIASLVIAGILSRSETFCRKFQRHKLFFAILLLFLIVAIPIWAFLGSNYKADLSRQERAGSVVIGIQLVQQRPFLGYGWNSYETLMDAYQINMEDVSPNVSFRTIHNMFVSYAEQAGIVGLLYCIFPFMLIIFASEAPVGLRLASISSLLAASELGGDVAYTSLFWLWTAIVINWNKGNLLRKR